MSLTEQASPWPDDDRDVVFVLDTGNEAETAILKRWITSTAPAGRRHPTMVPADLNDETSDPSPWLHRALTRGDESALVVPVRVGWSAAQDRPSGPRVRDLVLGDPRSPGPLVARVVAARSPERITPLAAEPASVSELRRDWEDTHPSDLDRRTEGFDAYVLRMAGIALDVRERRLDGRRYKVPRHVIQGVAHRPSFRLAIQALTETTGHSSRDLREESRGYLEEMAAQPSAFFIDWAGKLSRKIIELGYGDIVADPDNVEMVRRHVRDHPSAFLFTHKSHIDGMAVISVLYDNDLPAPHQVGGINMAFRGLGTLARRGGTIFIRRAFGDNPVYKITLQQYLSYLMEKRFPLSWAFEGTRSRSGKLMPPRYGILKYVVDAAESTGTDGLRLFPVSINYDLIGEVGEYARQDAGQPKEAESLSWFLGYLQRLRSPLGRVYVDFAEPVVVDLPEDGSASTDLTAVMTEVSRRVNALVPVTLPALMCTALLGSAPRALTLRELDAELRALMGWLAERDVRMAISFDPDEHDRLEELATLTFDRGLIDRHVGPTETVFSIGDGQFAAAGYYRNTIIHYFIHKALVEMALTLVGDLAPDDRVAAFWDEVTWLRDLLDHEFVWGADEAFRTAIEAELSGVAPDWSDRLAGSSHEVTVLLGEMTPHVVRATLQPYLEAYWIVVDRFARLAGDETLDERASSKEALASGEQAFLRGRLTTRASIGAQMFKGAHGMLDAKGLVEPGEADLGRRRGELANGLRGRLDILSTATAARQVEVDAVQPARATTEPRDALEADQPAAS